MQRKISFSFGLILFVLVVNVALSSWSAERLIEHDFWVAHTQEVIGQLEGVLADVTTAESAQRGFLLTHPEHNRRDYLKPYHDARDAAQGRLRTLRDLIADNPGQQKQLDVLDKQVVDKFAELDRVIDERKNKNINAAGEAVETDEAQRHMDAIRDTVKGLRQDEEKLLHDRTLNAKTSANLIRLTVWSGAAFSVALLVVAYILVVRDLDRRHRATELVRREREMFEITLLGIGDGVITTDAQGRVTLMNPVAQRLTGWQQEDAAGRSAAEVFRIVDEETRQAVQSPAEKAIQTNALVGLANHAVLIARDGGERVIDDSGGPIHSNEGRVVGAVLVFRDVSARRAAEKAVAERARLAELSAEVGAAMAQGRTLSESLHRCTEAMIQKAGAAFARIWTFDEAEDMLELKASSGLYTHLDGPESRIPVGQHIAGRIAKERKPHSTQTVADDPLVEDPDWARREGMTAFAGHPLVVEDRLVGVMTLFARQPFTEMALQKLKAVADLIAVGIDRKRAEEAESRQREWLHVTLSSVGDGVITIDSNGRVGFMNPVAQALTGWTEAQAEGRPLESVFQIINENTQQPLEAPVGTVLEEGTIARLGRQTILVSRDGTERPIAGSVAPIRNGVGAVQGVVLVFRDVGEIRLQEREREGLLTREQEARSRAEVSEAQLAEAARRKDNFLAMLGHELRNPLAPIRNAVAVLGFSDNGDANVREARGMIDRQIKHLTRMIDDLLDASRIANGKIQLRSERLDVVRLVKAVADDHRSELEAAGLKLETTVPDKPVWVEGDSVRLTQVITNLLMNSSKFTDTGGRITVRVVEDTDKRRARIVVTDTGVGMEAALLERLFEPFEQADRSLDRSRGGLGLGLAVVKGIVELHGGEVQAFSAGSGRGSEFSFWLLLAEEPAAAVPPVREAPAQIRGLSVLIIEDNKDAADSLRTVLEMSGHNPVTVAYSGSVGLDLARDLKPQVILCDLGLPGLSGFEVAQALRADPGTSPIRLIAISGYGQDEDRRRAAQAGFDAMLVKPVEIESLQRLLADSSK